MTENELATIIVDACFKVHKALGPGLLESAYERVLAVELGSRPQLCSSKVNWYFL
jgi:GxxExxY protein